MDWRCVTETTFLSIKIQELQPWTSAALTEESKKKMTGILSIEAISFDMSKVSKIFHQDPSKIQQTSFLVIQKFELPPQKKNTEFHMFPSRIYPIFVHQIQVLHCAPNGHRPCHLHKWMRCRKKKTLILGWGLIWFFWKNFTDLFSAAKGCGKLQRPATHGIAKMQSPWLGK